MELYQSILHGLSFMVIFLRQLHTFYSAYSGLPLNLYYHKGRYRESLNVVLDDTATSVHVCIALEHSYHRTLYPFSVKYLYIVDHGAPLLHMTLLGFSNPNRRL